MSNKIDFDRIDLSGTAPAEEPERQLWYMKRAKQLLEEKQRELGRPVTAMVKTFGCP